jgi:hypothetical protein
MCGGGLVPVRGVFVPDETGNRRHEYFSTTDPKFDPAPIIHYFTCRWSTETTFPEMRAQRCGPTSVSGPPEDV